MQRDNLPSDACLRILLLEHANEHQSAEVGRQDALEGRAVRLVGEPHFNSLARDANTSRYHSTKRVALSQYNP